MATVKSSVGDNNIRRAECKRRTPKGQHGRFVETVRIDRDARASVERLMNHHGFIGAPDEKTGLTARIVGKKNNLRNLCEEAGDNCII